MNIWTVLTVILVVLVVILGLLYYFGNKAQQRQLESQKFIEASSQTANVLIIDKKKMKLKEAPLPKMVYEQSPKYLRWQKIPVIKAKIGPRVVNLVADAKVFNQLPVKAECKVKLSGIYITEVIKGGIVDEKELKRRKKANEKAAKKAAKEAKKAAKSK
ncbi:MAG: hypothetical protein Q4B86_03665 [Eubacteriales bacterium]|nr:hypothetical protein [Eubacteriales bacterium]